jgi:hypothetical protein
VTKSISSRSAKATPKMVAEPVINGTPPTDESSESTLRPLETTSWTIRYSDRSMKKLTIFGGKGRVSFSRGTRGDGGEARFYRNESTKVYDAVVTGVESIVSERAVLTDMTVSSKLGSTVASTGPAEPLPVMSPPWAVLDEEADEKSPF